MSSTDKPKIEYERDKDYIRELTYTPTGENNPSEVEEWRPYRYLRIIMSNDVLVNDGISSVKVTLNVVSGLDVVRHDDPTVLDYDGDVTLSVDGQQTTKTLSNGSVEFDLTTDKSAGSEIEIVAGSLDDHPAKSDRATIEVVQA